MLLNSLSGVRMLNKSEQRQISGKLAPGGGSGSSGRGTCGYYQPTGTMQYDNISLTCPCVVTQTSKANALAAYGNGTGPVTNWCCDSCSSASWYQTN